MYSAPSLLAYCLSFVTSQGSQVTDAEDTWSYRGHLGMENQDITLLVVKSSRTV